MRNFVEKLVALLGHGPTGVVYKRFLEQTGLKPSIESMDHGDYIISFPEAGVRLIASDQIFDTVLIHLDERYVKNKYFRRLTHGITVTDSRNEVQAKLSVKPFSSDRICGSGPVEFTDQYRVPPFVFSFTHEADTGIINFVGITKV